jgi:1-deoxy-D-xylulose-5-phosphate reductoisomerase
MVTMHDRPSTAPRSLTILGSTGSIGTQAIDVVRSHPGRFRVDALSAGGGDVGLLARQAADLGVAAVAVADATRAGPLEAALADAFAGRDAAPELLAGPHAAAELAGRGSDVVLNGVTGSVGLGPTLAALRGGSTLALANKESLVAGGALVRAAQQRADQIVPVDSEHSAIAQCLRSGGRGEVRRLVLTASGGPFRGWAADDVKAATVDQALAHPTWAMGPVVTVNSASLMNKGLELIEAHLLFDVPVDDITVVVHPQSVVHSMVEFVDGSTIAQASPPDMRLPIALGLSWPERLDVVTPPCDWTRATSWTFEPLDDQAFPAVGLARAAFLSGRAGFGDIVTTVERVLAAHGGTAADRVTLDDVSAAEDWARARANELLGRR